jgi:hypothetical protein
MVSVTYQCIFNFLSLSFFTHWSFILTSMGFHIQFDNRLVQFIIEHNLRSSVPYSIHEFKKI